MLCLAAGRMTAALPRDPYLHLPPIGSESPDMLGTGSHHGDLTAQRGACRGLAVGLSSCPGHSRLVAVSRPPVEGQPCGRWRGRQAALFLPEVHGPLGGLFRAPPRTLRMDESVPAHQSLSCSPSPNDRFRNCVVLFVQWISEEHSPAGPGLHYLHPHPLVKPL